MPKGHEGRYKDNGSNGKYVRHGDNKSREISKMSPTERAIKGGDIIQQQRIEWQRNNDAKLNKLTITPNMEGPDEDGDNPCFHLNEEQRASRDLLSSVELHDLHERDDLALTAAQNTQRFHYYSEELRERNERVPGWHEFIENGGEVDRVLGYGQDPHSSRPRDARHEVLENDHEYMWEVLNDLHSEERARAGRS